MRLVDDISKNQTFHTVKPLLNFWAAFSPSKEVVFDLSRFRFNVSSHFSRVVSVLVAFLKSNYLG